MLLKRFEHFKESNTNPVAELVAEPAEYRFDRLIRSENTYSFSGSVPFSSVHSLKPETIDKVFDFAYSMVYTPKGYHRSRRSGGKKKRKNGQKFADTFQGKIAECAACNYFYKYDKSVYPDFNVEGVGEWDSVDLTVNNKEVAVKSTKDYGQLLLLETKDWNDKGYYIPNIKKGIYKYDYVMLVRIKPSCEDLLKKKKLLYSKYVDRDELKQLVKSQKWSYDYAGYITYDELLHIIKNKYILPQNGLLNGKMPMDAENYYVQAYNMKQLDTIFEKEENADVL